MALEAAPAAVNRDDELISNWRDAGYVSVDFDYPRDQIESLFDDFLFVIDEVYDPSTPAARARQLVAAMAVSATGLDGYGRKDSHGFIARRRAGEPNIFDPHSGLGTEDKDVLRFTPLTAAHVAHVYRAGQPPAHLKRLVTGCTEVMRHIQAGVRPVFRELGLEDVILAPENHPEMNVHLLNLNRYLNNESEEHLDRSKFTAAPWENVEGLEGLTMPNPKYDRHMTVQDLDAYRHGLADNPIDYVAGQMKIFAGAGINHLTRAEQHLSGDLTPLLHRVSPREGIVIPPVGRLSLQLFMNETRYRILTMPTAEETDITKMRQYLLDRR